MKINCDLGEGLRDIDTKLLPLVDQANIACGAHAGDDDSIRRCLALAKQHQTEVGIHPSYPDRENFGRISLKISSTALQTSLNQQIEHFLALSREYGIAPMYVKPHGALYNDLMHRPALRDGFFSLIAKINRKHDIKLAIMLSAALYRDDILMRARALQLSLIFEAFADRRYQLDGSLVPRKHAHAVLTEAQEIVDQYRQLQEKSQVNSEGASRLKLHADSVCFHGDNPASVEAILSLRQTATEASL